jgi:CO/xanthine dehydrogenase Mo-binding subunit
MTTFPTSTFKVIGQPIRRIEGPDKTTGAARYAGDILLPGMLWAKVLRSPHPHARIRGIDTSRAEALPGVHAVLTAADVPSELTGRMLKDMPLLAQDRVRFAGEKVAVVAAEDKATADAATELIDVDYEELPAVYDALEALESGAPVLHEGVDGYTHGPWPALWPTDFPMPDPKPANQYCRISAGKGDLEAGFAQADRIFEHRFKLPMTHQAYMEPHACVVDVDASGHVDIWAHNKQPHGLKAQVAGIAGIEPDSVRVNVAYIGGDFGGKSSFMDVPLMYFVSKAAGRPIKMVMSYTEEFMASNPRHPAYIDLKTGVMNDGTIVARHARSTLNCGAYAAFKPQAAIVGAGAGGGYNIPNTLVEIDMVYTNTVPRGHSRAPGTPQATFAVESHTDIIAKELGIDPLEFRLKNVLHDGDKTPSGREWKEITAEQTLRAAAEAIGWGNDKPGPNVGRGLSLFDHPTGFGNSTATVKLEQDGTVRVLSPSYDQGAGVHTVVQQIVAEELGLTVDQVVVDVVGTDDSPTDSGVGNSRTTFLAGQAAVQAAVNARNEIIRVAGDLLECPEDDVEVTGGQATARGRGGQSISYAEIAVKAAGQGEPVSGFAEFKSGSPDITSFVTQAAEVEVDPDTGQVSIRKFVTVVDSGTIINPIGHRGQINGGFVTGLGYALMEEMPVSDGHVETLSFADYKIPTMMDVPELTAVYLPEVPSGPTPYQGKSVGETHNPAVGGAIANAIADAVGVRLHDLPATAEKVYRGLKGG